MLRAGWRKKKKSHVEQKPDCVYMVINIFAIVVELFPTVLIAVRI